MRMLGFLFPPVVFVSSRAETVGRYLSLSSVVFPSLRVGGYSSRDLNFQLNRQIQLNSATTPSRACLKRYTLKLKAFQSVAAVLLCLGAGTVQGGQGLFSHVFDRNFNKVEVYNFNKKHIVTAHVCQ